MGHPPGAPNGDLGRVQVRAPADAGSPARAVPALPPDRRGVRLSEPRVRGLGGGRRDRDARDARGRGGHQDVCRVHRSRCFPARLGKRVPDDDAARGRRRPRLHAGAGRAALRRPARSGAGLHRPERRHERQHPWRPGHRGQDRRAAHRAVRLGGERARACGRAVACTVAIAHRARRAGARFEAPGDDASRPGARHRPGRRGLAAAGSLAAQGDLPPLRVPRAARSHRHARRCASRSRAPESGVAVGGVARGRAAEAARARRPGRGRRTRRARHGRRSRRDERPKLQGCYKAMETRSRCTTPRRCGSTPPTTR